MNIILLESLHCVLTTLFRKRNSLDPGANAFIGCELKQGIHFLVVAKVAAGKLWCIASEKSSRHLGKWLVGNANHVEVTRWLDD